MPFVPAVDADDVMSARILLNFLGRIVGLYQRVNLPALLVSLPLKSAVLRCPGIRGVFLFGKILWHSTRHSRCLDTLHGMQRLENKGGKIDEQNTRGVNLFGYAFEKERASIQSAKGLLGGKGRYPLGYPSIDPPFGRRRHGTRPINTRLHSAGYPASISTRSSFHQTQGQARAGTWL